MSYDPPSRYDAAGAAAAVTTTSIGAATTSALSTEVTSRQNGDAARMVVLVYSGGAYPTRPAGVAAGLVTYTGPVAPTDALTNDVWINNS